MHGNNKGYIITASISSAKKIVCDELWQITRSDNTIPGAFWVPQLAPGWDLFNQYSHNWKGHPADEWWPQYKEAFDKELQSEEKLTVMRKLWRLVDSGKVIALLCFCPDNTYCHRRLVAEFFEMNGMRTEEYSEPITKSSDPVSQLVLF